MNNRKCPACEDRGYIIHLLAGPDRRTTCEMGGSPTCRENARKFDLERRNARERSFTTQTADQMEAKAKQP